MSRLNRRSTQSPAVNNLLGPPPDEPKNLRQYAVLIIRGDKVTQVVNERVTFEEAAESLRHLDWSLRQAPPELMGGVYPAIVKMPPPCEFCRLRSRPA